MPPGAQRTPSEPVAPDPTSPSPGVAAAASGSAAAEGMRASSVLLAGRLVSVLIGFTTQVLLVRTLAKDDYGLFALGIAVAGGVRIVVSLGHNRSIARFFSLYRERRDTPRLLGTLVMETLLITGLGSLAVATAFLVAAGADGSRAAGIVALLVVMAPLEALEELLENLFASFGRVRAIVLRQHIVSPLMRLAVVGGLVLSGAGVRFVVVGYVCTAATGVVLYAVLLRRLLRTDDLLSRRDGRRNMPIADVFRFSVPMLTTELVYLTLGTLNVVLLGALRGTVPVATLRAILPFAELNLLVRRQFHRLFLPLAAVLHERGGGPDLADAYWRGAAWLAVLTFPLYAVTGPLAAPVTTTLLGEEYASSAACLAVLATGFYVNAAAGFNAEVLQAAARLRYLVGVNAVTAAVALGGAVLGAQVAGAVGVAAANAVALVVQNGLNQVGLRSVLGSAWPRGAYRRVYAAAALGVLALYAAQLLLEPPLPAGIALAALISLAVVTFSAPALRFAESFPRLRRLPGLTRLP